MLHYSSMKKGGIKRFKGHADNCQIVKLVYVHEGYTEKNGGRREFKNAIYFGGIYNGKDNEKLWKEVKGYIEKNYKTEKICFYSDGGALMKKGIEILGAELASDGFHIQKYIRGMAVAGGSLEEDIKKLEELTRNGKKKDLEEWAREKTEKAGKKEKRKLEESWKYIKNNWRGIRNRMKRTEEKEAKQYLSSSEILSWEKKHTQTNGKYIKALQASVSSQVAAKVFFQTSPTGLY